jgi:hypothetical protein
VTDFRAFSPHWRHDLANQIDIILGFANLVRDAAGGGVSP